MGISTIRIFDEWITLVENRSFAPQGIIPVSIHLAILLPKFLLQFILVKILNLHILNFILTASASLLLRQ